MIVKLAKELGEEIQALVRLRSMTSQASVIEETADKLSDLRDEIKPWTTIYEVIEPYLLPDYQTKLRSQSVYIHSRITNLREEFEDQPNQREDLNKLLEAAKRLNENTLHSWTAYTQGEIAPLKQLAEFARSFPRMQGRMEEIDNLLAALNATSQKLPRQREEIKSFLNNKKTLDQKLGNIKGISAEQKEFINRVQNGTATLNDLNEPLLSWCKEENLATRLRVTLGPLSPGHQTSMYGNRTATALQSKRS